MTPELSVRVSALLHQDVKKVQTLFQTMDGNNTGTVSSVDFAEGLRLLRITLSPRELFEVQRMYDPRGEGRINYEVRSADGLRSLSETFD